VKTIWNQEYIDNRYRGWEWRKAKKLELQARTGVPWSCDAAHGKYRFLPAFKAQQVHIEDSFRGDAEQIKTILDNSSCSRLGIVTFLALADRAGMSLVRVMAAVKSLWQQQAIQFTVNRMGDAVAVRSL